MHMVSPRELSEDPRKWLSVPHELHEQLLSLQEMLFPGFTQKLEDDKIHCLECEGIQPFRILTADTLEPGTCTGWIGEKDNVVFLHTVREGGGIHDDPNRVPSPRECNNEG